MLLLRSNDASAMFLVLICELLVFLPMMVILIISHWKVLKKAGCEGWECLIPIYGTYVLCTKVAGKDTNHFILHLIPFVNIYAAIVTYIAVAKSFGKDDGFGFGLFFLGVIFWPWLGFSKSINYIGPGGVIANPDSSNSLTKDWQNPNKPGGV